MNTEKNILMAFLLNIFFSIFEVVGGIFTNSVAIIGDAIHDFGDAISIGISYIMEKKSKKKPDNQYTFGYSRYSILGALITTTILISSSVLVIYNSIVRIINPVDINYNGMIVLSIIGIFINIVAAYCTKEGNSINQKAVNLHMLEDVLGWIIVFIGSIIMRFTNIRVIDPIMSILVASYILINALKNLREILDLFLEKVPNNISMKDVKKHLLNIEGINCIDNIHIWSLDGFNNYATMLVKTDYKNLNELKNNIRKELLNYKINHVIIEIEDKEKKHHNKTKHKKKKNKKLNKKTS